MSRVSLEVIPKWSQRAGSPTVSATWVRNAITSWRTSRSISVRARDVDARPRAQRSRGLGRDHAALGELLGDGQLDLEPAPEAPLVAPDRLHLRARVALDHGGPSLRKT